MGGVKVSLVPGPSWKGVRYNTEGEGGRVYPVGRVNPPEVEATAAVGTHPTFWVFAFVSTVRTFLDEFDDPGFSVFRR